MNFFRKLFEISLKKDTKTQLLFWGIVVIINAGIGIHLAFLLGFSKIGTTLGVCIWILIYGLFLGALYQRLGETGHKKLQISLFIGYYIKTFYSLLGIIWLFILWILDVHGSLNGLYSIDLGGFYFSISILDFPGLFGRGNYLQEVLLSFGMTILHGVLLSILTLVLGIFLYPFVRLYSKKHI